MGNAKQGRPKGQAPKPEVLEKETEVVKLRRGGLTWDLIAQRVGYSHPASARDAYMRASARIVRDDVEEIRRVEQDRLDMAQTAIWSKVLQGDTQAVNTLIRIMERRAKMFGLDQPTKIQAEVITYDAGGINTELANILELIHSSTTRDLDRETGEVESVTD